jgi:hypothetical protein
MKISSIAAVWLLAYASLSSAQDGPASPANTDPILMVGMIITHLSDGDGSGPHHSIVAILSDKSQAHPVTIEFNRLEPVLQIGIRYSFSYKPSADGDGNAIRSNGRQVYELDEDSVTINPPASVHSG